MLTHISIRNFAIIEHWDLELQDHLTVVTGESGAGKSMLIDAIELGLGGRGDTNLVRQGAERSEVVLSFDVSELPDVQNWLIEQDFDAAQECILRRILTQDGRSRTSLNGTPCTQAQIKALASLLMNIHGQHQNQALLNKSYQLSILDYFANHPKLLDAVNAIHSRWHQCQQRLNQLQNNRDNFSAQVELLQYQVNELDELGLSETEYDELDTEHKALANAEQYLSTCQGALEQLDGEDGEGALRMLHQTLTRLSAMNAENAHIHNAIELINTAIIQLDETQSELQTFLDHFSADPERLAQIETRLETIHTLARKHHVEPSALYDKHLALQHELSGYLNAASDISSLQAEQTILCQQFAESAKALRQSRERAAKQLSQAVSEKIQLLGMKGGVFDMQFHPNPDTQPRAHGSEQIEFVVSANPGQPLQPLSKVASGGEISRIALAIQVISSQTMITPTLVFDEVDVGIGGNTAAVVGTILRDLGDATQVICITHQPQVAVCGHQHVHMQKTTDPSQNRTHTDVVVLDETARIEEVARMLGGMKITEKTIANAKELMASV